MKKALVIFSGGQDSTTCLGWAMNRYSEVMAVSFKYGQKHRVELEQARKITEKLNIKHTIIDLDFMKGLTDSALTNNGDVSINHSRLKHLPASFVPNRNGLFILIAHTIAQENGIEVLVTGVSQEDYSGYPDCRAEFVESMIKTLNVGSDANIELKTPLINLDKEATFKLAEEENVLDVVLQYSHTCYNGVRNDHEWGAGCGECPACKLRKRGYERYKGVKNV